jgi:hypothetical protein
VLRTWRGEVLVAGTLVFGIVLPLLLHRFADVFRRPTTLTLAAAVLFGGLLLRYGIVTTPGEILRQGPAAAGAPAATDTTERVVNGDPSRVVGFSPEDGRLPGGGRGADPDNRPADLHPRSKAFKGD